MIFDKNWFKKHQSKLLWLLNKPVVKYWFRYCLRIRKYDCSQKITEITPNSISWGDRYFKKNGEWYLERTTDFRTHNKYSKRLLHAFYPIWWVFHQWDMMVNFFKLPKLNLGFDTLTVYPDAGDPGATTVDGDVWNWGYDAIWSTHRSATGNSLGDGTTFTKIRTVLGGSSGTNYWGIGRIITLFNTSSLGTQSIINSAILSLFGSSKSNPLGLATPQALAVVASNPASNTTLVGSDYATLGSVRFATDISYNNWSTVGYNDFTLNANGLAAINKTGISKFGFRSDYDLDNVAPTPNSANTNDTVAYSADQAGTTQDPKLVVTYTISTTKAAFLLNFI